jgi:hypothetical protein
MMRPLALIGLVLVLVIPGCSQGGRQWKATYAARGKVFFETKPAKGARVVFHPAGEPDPRTVLPQAQVGEDGSFVVSTYKAEDGAPSGSYTVTVTLLQNGGPVNLLPERYADPAASDLKVTIEEKDNDLEPFNLTR